MAVLSFDVVVRGERRTQLTTKLIGEYNVKNALAAFALASELGWEMSTVVKAIASFDGIGRGLQAEHVRDWRGEALLRGAVRRHHAETVPQPAQV